MDALKKAIGNGSVTAKRLLATYYLSCESIEEVNRGIKLLREAMVDDHISGIVLGSYLIEQPKGKNENIHEGLEILEQYEDPTAWFQLGMYWSDSEQKVEDIRRGIEYLQRSADSGISDAKLYLAKLYIFAEDWELGIPADIDRGYALMEELSDEGKLDAQVFLASPVNPPNRYSKEKHLERLAESANSGSMEAGCRYVEIAFKNEILSNKEAKTRVDIPIQGEQLTGVEDIQAGF